MLLVPHSSRSVAADAGIASRYGPIGRMARGASGGQREYVLEAHPVRAQV